jgi:hypothetical protein
MAYGTWLGKSVKSSNRCVPKASSEVCQRAQKDDLSALQTPRT